MLQFRNSKSGNPELVSNIYNLCTSYYFLSFCKRIERDWWKDPPKNSVLANRVAEMKKLSLSLGKS